MPFGIVAYASMLFSWTTFLETAVYDSYNFLNKYLKELLEIALRTKWFPSNTFHEPMEGDVMSKRAGKIGVFVNVIAFCS